MGKTDLKLYRDVMFSCGNDINDNTIIYYDYYQDYFWATITSVYSGVWRANTNPDPKKVNLNPDQHQIQIYSS